MMPSLRSDDVSVGDLLNGLYLYEIPAFQRDYSWGEQEAQGLLDDVVTAMDTVGDAGDPLPFFLGTMLFVSSDEPDASVRSALVVDGQQRLITLTILIAVLRDLLPAGHRDPLHAKVALLTRAEPFEFDVYHVQARSHDTRFLERRVQRRGATLLPKGKSDLKPVNEAQRRMDSVRTVFARRLKQVRKERGTDRLAALADFVLETCRVLRLWAPDLDYAYRLFLSINKPGLPLTEEDIVLAEVVGPLAIAQRRRFDTIISEMTRYRQPRQQGVRQDKTFFTHLAAAQMWTSKDRMISLLRREVAREGGPMRFAANVFEPMAEAYLLTRANWPREALSEAVWLRLDRLRLLEVFCDNEWVAPAMLALHRLRDDEPGLCVFLEALDRFAYALALHKTGPEERRQVYRPIIERIRQSAQMPDPQDLFRVEASREAAAIRKAALKLNGTTNGIDKAVLLRLDAHLSGRSVGAYLEMLESEFTGQDRLTLEHILPEGPTLSRSSGWWHEFKLSAYRREMANSIANLVLIEEQRNKKAAQSDFAVKKDIFFAGQDRHRLFLTDAIRSHETWTRQTLEERYAQMMQNFCELFGFSGPIPSLPPTPDPAAEVTERPADEPASKVKNRRKRSRRTLVGGRNRQN